MLLGSNQRGLLDAANDQRLPERLRGTARDRRASAKHDALGQEIAHCRQLRYGEGQEKTGLSPVQQGRRAGGRWLASEEKKEGNKASGASNLADHG